MCLACSHVVRCSETALVFNLTYVLDQLTAFANSGLFCLGMLLSNPGKKIHKLDQFTLSQEFCPFWIENKRPFSFVKCNIFNIF